MRDGCNCSSARSRYTSRRIRTARGSTCSGCGVRTPTPPRPLHLTPSEPAMTTTGGKVPTRRFEDLTRKQRRRLGFGVMVRTSLWAVFAIALYYVLPLHRPADWSLVLLIV